MRVKVLLQITADDGTTGAAEIVEAFEKQTERPEDLGLSIAEGKALTAAVQQRLVGAQVPASTARAATPSSLARDCTVARAGARMARRRCRRCPL